MKAEIIANEDLRVKLRIVPENAMERFALMALAENFSISEYAPTITLDSGAVEYDCLREVKETE